jgi:hypothetical protein
MKKKKLLTDRTNGLPDEIAKTGAKEMQEEIDWGIMCDLLKEVGWVKIQTTWSTQSLEDAYDLKNWCRSNLYGNYKGRGKIWLFEKEKDAIMFALKWS